MESVGCYFVDGPKRGETMLLLLPPPDEFTVGDSKEPRLDAYAADDPPVGPSYDTVDYHLHEFEDETHRALVYASELDQAEAYLAYCRDYANEHIRTVRFLIDLALGNGVMLRRKDGYLEAGVEPGSRWTPTKWFVAQFLARYEMLFVGFFQIMQSRTAGEG